MSVFTESLFFFLGSRTDNGSHKNDSKVNFVGKKGHFEISTDNTYSTLIELFEIFFAKKLENPSYFVANIFFSKLVKTFSFALELVVDST